MTLKLLTLSDFNNEALIVDTYNDQPYNQYFNQLGYGTRNFINESGSLIIVAVVLLGSLILTMLLRIIRASN